MSYAVGHVIADEAIEQALRRQLADVVARISAGTLTDYLGQALLNAQAGRRAAFAAWMSGVTDPNEHWPPQLFFSFRRDPLELPAIVVRLASENDGQFVGETAGRVTLGADTEAQELRAEVWTSAVDVVVESMNADRCRYLYQLVKFWLGQERVTLAQRENGGFVEMRMTGQDLEFLRDLQTAGRFVYRRGLRVSAVIHQTDALNTRTAISSAQSSPSEVGSVIVPTSYVVPA